MEQTFEDLLTSLSEYLNIDIEPDIKGGCRLKINERFSIQLEVDSLREKIFFVASIFELSPGKFRENVLKNALKSNFLKEYPIGVLCYLHKQNNLGLFYSCVLKDLTPDKFHHDFQSFYEKALAWNEALHSGQLYPPNAFKELPKERPPFGLR